jgi:hypothetical protein
MAQRLGVGTEAETTTMRAGEDDSGCAVGRVGRGGDDDAEHGWRYDDSTQRNGARSSQDGASVRPDAHV